MDALLPLMLFSVLFLGIGGAAQLPCFPKRLWQHPLTFALSFLGAGGVIFFFGTIELVGRYGIAGLIGLFAFSLPFVFSPLFLEPLRWMSRSNAFTTLPDLLIYRFRHPWIGKASGLLMALAGLPLAAAQLSAFGSLPIVHGHNELLLMLLMIAVASSFIWLFGRPEKAVHALPGVTASATLIAIITLFSCGYLALNYVFGGMAEMNQWAETSGSDQVVLRFENVHALILLFLPMTLILPQHSYMQTLSNWWPRHSPSAWMIPALVMIITFPVIPLLWSGLEVPVDAPLHQYPNVLPYILNTPWLQHLSILTLLFVSVSLLVVIAMALGKVLLVCFAITVEQRFASDMDQWLFRRHSLFASLWLLAALGFSALSKSTSITDLSIAGMIGMIQLLPALVGTLYVPTINFKGVLAGMLVGTSLWLVGIVSYVFTGLDTLDFFGKTVTTGPGNWPFWLLESLVANLLVTLIVSLLTKTSREEKRHAYLCLVDSLPTPQRQSFEIVPLEQVRQRLAQWIGLEAAEREVALASKNIHLSRNDHRPLALRLLRDRLGFQLSSKLGTLKSEAIVEAVLPTGSGTAIDDITLLESQLASAGGELSGLAADLNKLRLFHRKTLENLPIGVCSLDPNGEVILWNLSMAQITGIKAADAEGAQFRDFKEPWGRLFDQFCQSQSDMWPAHEVDHPDNGLSWYHMTKHRAEETSPLYSGYQVVLMEDISDRLRLVQELAHAERLTSVGRLAAGVAHEIGNPVTGISCIAQDMIAESKEAETRSYANTILDLTNRISSIVRTLMDFSRSGGDVLTLSPVSLKTSVHQAIQLLKLDKSAKTVEFNLAIADDHRVMGDLHQLTQVFVNLLVNSRDASPAGSRIDVTCEQGEDNQLIVHVTDCGSGIPDDLMGRVMDPFFTTKEPGAGTGLGLSLVYSIVRLHKGSIKITSPVANGQGTKVSITLTTPTTSDWLEAGDE